MSDSRFPALAPLVFAALALLSAIPEDRQAGLVDSLQRLSAAAGEVPEQDWSTGWDL